MNGMTGFSYISKELDFGRLIISLRSLNSRFLEIKTTLPPIIQKIEPKLRSYLKENFRRGKIELFIELHLRKQINQVTIDEELAKNYFMSMKKISNKLGLLPDIEIVDVIKMPNVLSIIPPLDPPEEIIREVEKYTKTAINEVKKQRQREGEETKEDIEELIKKLEENILDIDEISKNLNEKIEQKVKEKITKYLQEFPNRPELDHSVIAFLMKIDINEEITRLKMHITNLKETLENEESIGKKGEFVIQEIIREANTISSKSLNYEISKNIVEIKSIAEKIREHLQNIE
jgi:uncharacterized protein (TIGR00255 family)